MSHSKKASTVPLNQLPLPLNVESRLPNHLSKDLEQPLLPDETVWENEITQELKGFRCPDCGSVDMGILIYGQLPQGDRRLDHLTRVQLLIPVGGYWAEEDLYCNECSNSWKSGKNLSEKVLLG
jgi:hypothetical protein